MIKHLGITGLLIALVLGAAACGVSVAEDKSPERVAVGGIAGQPGTADSRQQEIVFGWKLSLLTALLSALLGALLAGFLVPIASRKVQSWLWDPRLSLKPDQNPRPNDADEYSKSVSHWVRLSVHNEQKRRTAENCRCFLANVERWNENENRFESTKFRDVLQLLWSCLPALDSFPIPGGGTKLADIAEYRRDRDVAIPQFRHPEGGHLEIPEYESIFRGAGRFRFTVLVAADNVPPARKEITVIWDGRSLRILDGR